MEINEKSVFVTMVLISLDLASGEYSLSWSSVFVVGV
jgi:hypothetical protein